MTHHFLYVVIPCSYARAQIQLSTGSSNDQVAHHAIRSGLFEKMFSFTRIELYEVVKVQKKWNLKYGHAFAFIEQAMGLEDKPEKIRAQKRCSPRGR